MAAEWLRRRRAAAALTGLGERRYRELLRSEIAHTVASLADVDEELRHLIAVMSG